MILNSNKMFDNSSNKCNSNYLNQSFSNDKDSNETSLLFLYSIISKSVDCIFG